MRLPYYSVMHHFISKILQDLEQAKIPVRCAQKAGLESLEKHGCIVEAYCSRKKGCKEN